MRLDHCEGFEKEKVFCRALAEALEQCPNIKSATVKLIIGLIAPAFLEGLHDRRPCVRNLRYLGPWWTEYPTAEDAVAPLKVGGVYESLDFNGATYTIKTSDQRTQIIGSAYFERLT